MHNAERRTQTPPNVLQARAALKLYERLISPGGVATYQDLAEDLGVVASTVHRQCTGDCPIQLRTVLALGKLDPEGAREILDMLAAGLGFRLVVVEKHLAAVPSPEAALEAVADDHELSGHALQLEARALRDGLIEPLEWTELQRHYARQDRAETFKRSTIEAMVPSSRGGGQLGALRQVRS